MELRSARPGDRPAVRRVFRATVGLGAPLPFDLPPGYEDLCLGWYLGPGLGDAAVLVDDGRVVGYALVCTDEAAHRRATTRAAVGFVLRSVPAALDVRSRDRATFVRARWRDGLRLRRGGGPVAPAHAHVNVLPGRRAGRAGRLLVHHVDERVGRAGLPAWYAEINTRGGRRAAALTRFGAEIVRREPNLTLTELTGEPVDRLTALRRLDRARPMFGATSDSVATTP